MSIEEAIKETFAISRTMILHQQNGMGKNKPGKRFTSRLFTVDLARRTISPKPAWRLHRGFQEELSLFFRRGLYKMFLEALEADSGSALDSKYDFIREFARYGLGDYPVFYFLRRLGIVLLIKRHVEHPEILWQKDQQMKYLIHSSHFVEFELLGHVFGLPIARRADVIAESYLNETTVLKRKFFQGLVMVKYFNDVDLSMNMFKENGGYEAWLANQYGKRLMRF